jgi:hypothetical protein
VRQFADCDILQCERVICCRARRTRSGSERILCVSIICKGGCSLEIGPEELRRHYAELSDEGLLSINRNDLTELAQQYYDAEVRGRGLHDESPSDVQTDADHEELVVVDTFVSHEEAALGRALLRSAEIPAYLENELTSTWTGIGGLRLMVPRSVFEQSKEILETRISDDELAAQAEAADAIEGDETEQPE